MPKTIGVEEEFLLIDDSHEQGHIEADMLEEILAEASGVSPEIFDSHLEVQTAPCSNFVSLKDEILRGRLRAQTLARKYDLNICASGTVGCYKWRDVKPLPFPRVVGIVEDFSETFRSQSIAALHLHTKVDSLQKSLHLVNALSWYTWLFLALSGSSRFYDQRDTGLNSRRLSLIGQTPRTGLPQYYASTKDYEYEQQALKLGGWEKNKLWYYLRHNPNHDTVELRIMDSVPRVEDVLAVSALFLCMCEAIEERILPSINMGNAMNRVLAQINIERAMCSGVKEFSNSGQPVRYFITPEKEQPISVLVHDLFEKLTPVAHGLGCYEALAQVRTLIEEGNASMRQYEAVKQSGNIASATLLVMDETLQGI